MILSCFFQAEDGIRDIGVTGVQTCALPISRLSALALVDVATGAPCCEEVDRASRPPDNPKKLKAERSEERRVGKGVDLGGRRIIKKKITQLLTEYLIL